MGRAPCCDKASVKKGPWSPEEDRKLKDYIHKNGTGGNWIALPHKAGLKRCGKSCRLRWLNYLRPNIKHGDFSEDEDRIICSLFATIGSRWSIIAAQLPGRTDNDIKNYWNTKLKKKLMQAHGLHPTTHRHRRSKKQQQQSLFFSTEEEAPSPAPLALTLADPCLSLQYLSTSAHNFTHQYGGHDDSTSTTSSLLCAGGGLMFGGINNGDGEQHVMSSSAGSDSVAGGLGLYFEFCNNGGGSGSHGHDDDDHSAAAVAVAAGLAVESFVLRDDDHHNNKAPLLLAAGPETSLDYYQYGADTSYGYDEEAAAAKPFAPAGGGGGSSSAFFEFYGYSQEKSGSSCPAVAGVCQQRRFMY